MAQIPRIVETDLDGVVDLLALAWERGGGAELRPLDEMMQGCRFFRLENSADEFAYAVQEQGDELWVQAAAGRGKTNLLGAFLATVERQGHFFGSIAFMTSRPGLVRKAGRYGYKVAEQQGGRWIMRKILHVQ
jgi:hypothetical protein